MTCLYVYLALGLNLWINETVTRYLHPPAGADRVNFMDKQDLDLISVLKILRDLLPGSSWQLPVGHVLLNLLELVRKTL